MKMNYINEYLEKNLSEKRRRHTYAVRDMALKLAETYGADKVKAELSALLHDMCKNLNIEEMNKYVELFNLGSQYINNSNLAHSKVAAKLIPTEFNISDEEILNAVSYHTTGRAEMSLLEKIIYLSDAIEPERNYPGVEKIRKMAFIDLNEACMMSLSQTADYIQSQNLYLDEDTIKAVEYFKELKVKGDSE
ncbi:MAG: bis(5'-nucleosyl)-tetraphosphatase (symmetrical) YqeK [Aminipila sp.]